MRSLLKEGDLCTKGLKFTTDVRKAYYVVAKATKTKVYVVPVKSKIKEIAFKNKHVHIKVESAKVFPMPKQTRSKFDYIFDEK